MSAAREAVARALGIDCGMSADGYTDDDLIRTADAVLAALRPIIAAEIRAWAENEIEGPHHDDRRTAVRYSSFNWPHRGKRGWIFGPFFGRLLTITVELVTGEQQQ